MLYCIRKDFVFNDIKDVRGQWNQESAKCAYPNWFMPQFEVGNSFTRLICSVTRRIGTDLVDTSGTWRHDPRVSYYSSGSPAGRYVECAAHSWCAQLEKWALHHTRGGQTDGLYEHFRLRMTASWTTALLAWCCELSVIGNACCNALSACCNDKSSHSLVSEDSDWVCKSKWSIYDTAICSYDDRSTMSRVNWYEVHFCINLSIGKVLNFIHNLMNRLIQKCYDTQMLRRQCRWQQLFLIIM